MDKEKMNEKELTEKEMEQVSGGVMDIPDIEEDIVEMVCPFFKDPIPCISVQKGNLRQCATCYKNN